MSEEPIAINASEIEKQLVDLLQNPANREPVIKACAGFVLRNNGSWEDAKDVFSEAIFRTYERSKTGQLQIKGGNLKSFLSGACKYIWLNKLKSKQTAWVGIMALQTTDNFEVDPFPEENQFENQLLVMRDCLSLLHNDCKTLLAMIYYQKKAYDEIAERLQISAGNARKKAERCRKKLKECTTKKTLRWTKSTINKK